MNKKYNSKKNNKKYRKKTKIRGGAAAPKSTVAASSVAESSTSVKKEKLNSSGKRELNSLDYRELNNNRSLSIYGTPSQLTRHQHYLLLGLDLVYNGIMYCWTPSSRLKSVSGPTIELYQINKFSSPSGKGGSGKIELNICNSLNETTCSENPICSYSKPKGSCNIKGNFIICNKKCKNSKWYLLDLQDENNIKMLCICFCWGSNFSESEFNMIWANGFRDNLLKVLGDNEYDVLMINGHSMGAGLAYLVTLKIFEDTLIRKLIQDKIKVFENLYIHLFGMGRLPVLSVLKFQQSKEKYNFNVYDIISYDKTKNIFDSRIDNIKVNAADCDYLSTRKPDFYCLNFSKEKSANKAKAISHRLTKKNLPSSFTTAQKEEYKNCLTESGWGDLYSPEWQKCQELMDKYHTHNTVETYLIDNNGILENIDKNKISFNMEVVDIDPDIPEKHPTGLLHSIKTYKNYFMKFLKSNNAI